MVTMHFKLSFMRFSVILLSFYVKTLWGTKRKVAKKCKYMSNARKEIKQICNRVPNLFFYLLFFIKKCKQKSKHAV